MATYYVRTDGSDSNAGTGPATNQAWQTITKAIGATGIAPGDTLYIAPGVYRGAFTAAFTNPTSEGQRILIAGNPTASQFSGVTAGPVIITNYSDNVTSSGLTLSITKNFITLTDLCIYGRQIAGNPVFGLVANFESSAFIVTRCYFGTQASNADVYTILFTITAGGIGPQITNSIFENLYCGVFGATHSGTWDTATLIRNCIVTSLNTSSVTGVGIRLGGYTSGQTGGIKIINCTVNAVSCVLIPSGANLSTTYPSIVQNCFLSGVTGISSPVNNGQITQSYNVINAATTLSNVASSATTLTTAFNPSNSTISKIQGWGDYPFNSPLSSVQANVNAGINTNSAAVDIYGTTWNTPSTPTIGASELKSYTPTGSYLPTERNASTITIAPGSTSQSIELYLGATGLTASTAGLSARYNRTRTASQDIPLVARTIAQAWTSGGFAEVDATNMPGVYRLDLPDAALAAGADDVTIVVRGASGMNGAVMTVKLSSGGLTSAQTAAAVWDEPYTSHTTASTFGARTLLTTADNRPAAVGTSNHIHANVHAIVDSTIAADELKGALLHNGTDYISADLLTPVSAATSVHIGPYQLLADGLGADQPLDVNVGTATSIDVQVTDANGTGIDITGATVSAKVYNSGGTLVATYAGTATYADNGRLSFGLTTTVTNTSGTYTVTVTRTTGATDTQIFGPLRLYVRPV